MPIKSKQRNPVTTDKLRASAYARGDKGVAKCGSCRISPLGKGYKKLVSCKACDAVRDYLEYVVKWMKERGHLGD